MAEKPQRLHDHIALPKEFYSDVTGKPLERCIMCEKFLLKKGTLYVIEKAVQRHRKINSGDTIFEYAICFDCYETMAATLSVESMSRIQAYFQQHGNLVAKRLQLMEENNTDLNDWISHCAIKGTPMQDCSEYQLCCQCDGPDMLFTHLPMMLSEQALIEITEQLSAQTKEELDRFQEDFLGLPPDLKELFRDRSILVV